MLNKILLFINTAYFDQIDLKKEGQNLKAHFLYGIHQEFDLLLKQFKKYNSFILKIKNKDNNSLFYTGVEQKEQKKFQKRKKEIEQLIDNKILPDKQSIESHFVKTKVGKTKAKSLLSVLIIVTMKNKFESFFPNDNVELSYLFFLFPLHFGNMHAG